MRVKDVKWNDNSVLMTYLQRRTRDVGRRATKSPRSETAFSLWPYINSHVSRATTREVMLSRPENRGAFITHTAEAQPHGLGPVFDFLPRDFPEK